MRWFELHCHLWVSQFRIGFDNINYYCYTKHWVYFKPSQHFNINNFVNNSDGILLDFDWDAKLLGPISLYGHCQQRLFDPLRYYITRL
jgi:hypothetical protein